MLHRLVPLEVQPVPPMSELMEARAHCTLTLTSPKKSTQQEQKSRKPKHVEAIRKQKQLCDEEMLEFQKWLDEIDGNAADRAAEKAEREKAKEALSSALGDRIKQMEKFLEFLYSVRQQLGEHIYRTNRLYGGAYTAITYDISLTVEIMHDLGVMNNFHVSPIFHPIILPKKDKMDEDADKEKDEPSDATGAAGANWCSRWCKPQKQQNPKALSHWQRTMKHKLP